MEIDIFPISHRKDGTARNFDKVFLGILIITYIIAAFKTAQCIVGNDAEKEFVCFLLTIPIFVGYYALFVLVCHGIKTGLYAYFKSHRKEWNSIADREEMEEHIAQNLGHIQKKAQEKTATITNAKNAAPIADGTPKRESNVESHSPKEVSVTPEALAKLQLKRNIQKAHDELEVFINQVHIDRKQMNEAKVAREARKLEASGAVNGRHGHSCPKSCSGENEHFKTSCGRKHLGLLMNGRRSYLSMIRNIRRPSEYDHPFKGRMYCHFAKIAAYDYASTLL